MSVEPHAIRRELLLCLGFGVVAMPVGLVPNILLSNALFGDVTRAGELFFQPLPMAAAALCVALFPLTNALTELPTYFGYVAWDGCPAVALWRYACRLFFSPPNPWPCR